MADPDPIAWQAAKHHVLDLGPVCTGTQGHHPTAPDFIFIGAQKAGSTWLYKNLVFHPLVWLPPIKEINFFSSVHVAGHVADDARHRREQIADSRSWWEAMGERAGERSERAERLACLDVIAEEGLTSAWYRRIFAFAGPEQMSGDISPEYCLLPRAGIRHVLALNPNVRILALLRDPADRALSQARMLADPDTSVEALWNIVRSDALHVLAKYSDYPRWLARWRGLVGAERMFVASAGRVGTDPHGLLADICRFLGLPCHAGLFGAADKRVFAGPKAGGVTDEIRRFLRSRMTRTYEELAADWPDFAAEFAAADQGP